MRAGNGFCDLAGLQQLMRKLDQRVAAELWCGAGMRRAALHFHLAGGGAAGAEQQGIVLRRGCGHRRLAGQYKVVLIGELGNQLARADRADLLVGIEQHGELGIVAPFHFREDLQRMQDDGDAALVVGDTRPIDALAVDAPRLAGEDAALIDGVHVRHQHQLHVARTLERADHDIGAGAARGLAPLGFGAQRLQPRLGKVGHFGEPFEVGAAGFDHHHVAQCLDQLGLCGISHRSQLFVR